MTSPSGELQDLVVSVLRNDTDVSGMVGTRIYDNVPASRTYPYIALGDTDFINDDADCIDARIETLRIDCWSDTQGRRYEAKQLVDAVVSALDGVAQDLGDNALVSLELAQARVIGDPDGIKAHGIVDIEAHIEVK